MEAQRTEQKWNSKFRNEDEYLMGRAVEDYLRNRVLKDGPWYATQSYDYAGPNGEKTPKLHGAKDEFTMVDIDFVHAIEHSRVLTEAKAKTVKSFYKFVWPGPETPDNASFVLNRPTWFDYQNIERITGWPVWIVVVMYDTLLKKPCEEVIYRAPLRRFLDNEHLWRYCLCPHCQNAPDTEREVEECTFQREHGNSRGVVFLKADHFNEILQGEEVFPTGVVNARFLKNLPPEKVCY